MMSWIDEQIKAHRDYIARWQLGWGGLAPSSAERQLKILEALKAAREALESCEPESKDGTIRQAFDEKLVNAAIKNIDALGK